MTPGSEVSADLVDDLLSLPTQALQADLLRARGLLDAEGLDLLLDVADGLLNNDPGKARLLAELCARLAGSANAPAAVPRAAYILAGAHDLNGEFEEELRLTRFAHDGYVGLGMHLEALRTNVGKMGTLLDLGRYQEALDAGRVVLSALESEGELGAKPAERDSDLLAALVHQNRGICYEFMGQYDEALRAYAFAEGLYRDLGMTERLGEIFDNRGRVLSYLGRGNEALASHQAAAVIFDEAGSTLSHAMSLSNIGETHLRLANYMSGLDAFEQARRSLGSSDAHAVEYFLLRNIADAYLALNLHSEALAAYREVDVLLRSVGMEHDRARALWGMGSALIARFESDTAEEVLDEAARLFDAAENIPMLSGVMLEQAALLETRGDREAALAMARRALQLVSEEDWPVQQVYASLRLADLLMPDTALAEPHLLAARRLAERLALPQLRYRSNERLGHLRRLQGRDEEARVLLEAAVDEIERLRGAVARDAVRSSFLRDKTAAYEDLLMLHLASEDDERVRLAFAVAERAKSRALVDLLTGVVERARAGATDPELAQHIRTLQADLDGIYSELLGGSGGERLTPFSTLHTRAVELEQEISRSRLQARAGTPDLFAASMPPDDIQGQIPPDVILLAYHVVAGEVLAFVNARGRIRIARGLGRADEIQRLLQKLDIQWERFRAGQAFAGRHMAVLERSARQVLGALYDELVAALEPLLAEAVAQVSEEGAGIPKLAIVPHGLLHQVPFHALFDGERHLIERFEISYAPSATVYALCQGRETQGRSGAAVFGVDDPLIPAAIAEARAVAGCFPEVEVRTGEGAAIGALRKAVPGSGVVHLACHGLFRSDNPMFSALKLHDGWLTAAEVMDLDLGGALVTLSACESGRGEVVGGDEVLGLARAFLGAGAATLAVSLWLVQDETTAALMSRWYEQLRNGKGRAAALRAAQLELKERHPHPYYWAPFVLIGKR